MQVGVAVADIIREPPLYGGHVVPVKGYDALNDAFDDETVQAAYRAYLDSDDDLSVATKTALSAAWLRAYYPTIKGIN